MTPTPRSYFEDLYGGSEDPWGFSTRFYEARKYALTLASLPQKRYRRGFEPGCSIGVLTKELARRCDSLLAADLMESAVRAASERTRDLPGVLVERMAIPEEWPSGPFDLLVLSEIAYYFDADGLRDLLGVAVRSLETGATVVGVHWRGTTDYPLSGDETHAILDQTSGFDAVVHHREDDFVLDVWRYETMSSAISG